MGVKDWDGGGAIGGWGEWGDSQVQCQILGGVSYWRLFDSSLKGWGAVNTVTKIIRD